MATARLSHVRVAPRKLRVIANLIRGQKVDTAINQLRFLNKAGSREFFKLLVSAVANAEDRGESDPDELVVRTVMVDQGPTLKRFRPRARGRAGRIRKRTCHVTVIVSRLSPEQLEIERAKSSRRGQATNVAASRARRVASSRRSGEAAETPADAAEEVVDSTEAAEAVEAAEAAGFAAPGSGTGDEQSDDAAEGEN